jgi:UPF0489 domain
MIRVAVVESHNHALEHIHTTLRQRRLLNQDWSLLHFDAHADLACPGKHIPAVSCYRPHMTIRSLVKQSEMNKCHHTDGNTKEVLSEDSDLNHDDDLDSVDGLNLYELLDSTSSGIAEWVLPLVLAANLRSIVWVRIPNTVPLIPSGIHHYHVGVHVKPEFASSTLITNPCIPTSFLDLPLTAVVKVDWDCRYYLEDDSYVPTTDMILSQELELTVKEVPEEGYASSFASCINVQRSKSHVENSVCHAVDVCLDYFLCYNPFLKDIESLSSSLAKSFHDAVIQSKFYCDSYDGSKSNVDATNFASELFTFRQHFTRFLQSLARTRSQEDLVKALLPFYDNSQVGFKLLEQLQNAFNDVDDDIVEELIKALPHVSMPHTWGKIDEALIQERIMHMRKELLESQLNKTLPFIITIARSAEDGFTSGDVVDDLQGRVLYELHSIFCGCENQIQTRQSVCSNKLGKHSSLVGADVCCWDLVFDY